jgi:hypothetical protein
MWRELAQAGVYDRKMGAKDQEASELHTELSCCKEELTRCQSDLAQATSAIQLSHTAKNELTAELHSLQERVHLIEEQNSLLVKSLGGAGTRLVESEQTVLLKENCIKALMVEKEKCNKELMFEKKMTVELDVLRERIVLMQGHNDLMVGSLGEAEARLVDSNITILTKEQSIKALMDEMKVMKSVVDAQQKEIEMVLAMSQQVNMEKEKCLKELIFEKKMTAELDDLRPRMVSMQGQQEILVKSLGEAETSLAQAKLDNTEKEKRIRELTFELDTSRGNAKELTAEGYALREHTAALVASLAEAENRLEASKQNNLTDNMENEKRVKELREVVVKDNMENERRIKELREVHQDLKDLFAAEFDILSSHTTVVRAELQASKREKEALSVALEEAERAANDLSASNRKLVEEREVLQRAAISQRGRRSSEVLQRPAPAAAPDALVLLSALSLSSTRDDHCSPPTPHPPRLLPRGPSV